MYPIKENQMSEAASSPPAVVGNGRTAKRTWLGRFLADMVDIPWNGIIGSLMVGMLISAGAGRIHDMEKDVTQLKLQVQRQALEWRALLDGRDHALETRLTAQGKQGNKNLNAKLQDFEERLRSLDKRLSFLEIRTQLQTPTNTFNLDHEKGTMLGMTTILDRIEKIAQSLVVPDSDKEKE